jgi:hypothetical protein
MQDDNKKALAYWIHERERVRIFKERGDPKPWSQDWVFQQTYFCNVRREDDRVTRWIRGNWSPDKIGWDDYEYAMVVARFLNWPDTLEQLTAQMAAGDAGNFEQTFGVLEEMAKLGLKVWGNAYVVTTHGLPMGKAQYLCRNVLPNVYDCVGAGRWRGQYGSGGVTLARRHEDYMLFEGIASFMSAQILADLKNTPGHPLHTAEDWYEWSAPGPGSLRGLEWYHGKKFTLGATGAYKKGIREVADYLQTNYPGVARHLMPRGDDINMQDLQNCLCEFDKYMRVRTGKGRSKRGYEGK